MPPRRFASGPLVLTVVSVFAPMFAACERTRPVYEPKPPPPYVPEEPKDTGPIHVGVFGSLHGREGAFGRAEWQGITLAAEERNATNLVHDRPIELVVFDDMGRADGATTAGERFRTSDRVAVVLGGTTAARAHLAAVAAREIPLLAPSVPFGQEAVNASVFGGAPSAKLRMEALASHLKQSLGVTSIDVLVRADDAMAREMTQALAEALSSGSGSGVIEHSFTADTWPALLATWVASPSGPSTVPTNAPANLMVPFGGADAALLIATARKRGLATTRFLLASEPDIESLPADQRMLLDGTLVVSAFDPDCELAAKAARASRDATNVPDREAQAAFASRYRARFDDAPNERAWLGYLAAKSAFESLQRAPAFWPRDVRRALENAPPPTSSFTLLRVEAGRLVRAVPPQN